MYAHSRKYPGMKVALLTRANDFGNMLELERIFVGSRAFIAARRVEWGMLTMMELRAAINKLKWGNARMKLGSPLNCWSVRRWIFERTCWMFWTTLFWERMSLVPSDAYEKGSCKSTIRHPAYCQAEGCLIFFVDSLLDRSEMFENRTIWRAACFQMYPIEECVLVADLSLD